MPTWCARSWRARRASRQPAHGGAGGGASAAGAEGGGAGDGAVRDAAGPAAADRLRRAPGRDRRRSGEGLPVRGDAGLFAAAACSGVPATSGRRAGSTGWRARSAHFGGVPEEVLLDNAAALVAASRPASREVDVQRQAARLCQALGLPAARLRAVPGAHEGQGRARRRLREEERDRRAPLRELGGAGGASRAWTREVADVRVHGTTGEAPIARFQRDEARALRPLAGTPPFAGRAN